VVGFEWRNVSEFVIFFAFGVISEDSADLRSPNVVPLDVWSDTMCRSVFRLLLDCTSKQICSKHLVKSIWRDLLRARSRRRELHKRTIDPSDFLLASLSSIAPNRPLLDRVVIWVFLKGVLEREILVLIKSFMLTLLQVPVFVYFLV